MVRSEIKLLELVVKVSDVVRQFLREMFGIFKQERQEEVGMCEKNR